MSNPCNRYVTGVFLLANAASLNADPHYVQALHPYWGDETHYRHYLEKFTANVDSDVRSYTESEPEGETTYYIYEYSLAMADATRFTLDISCPETEQRQISGPGNVTGVADIMDASPDPVRGNPDPSIGADGTLSWPLDGKAGRQAMWFYSMRSPAPRTYGVAAGGGVITGTLPGPSCEANRPRARDLGMNVGILPRGEWNAITDVAGVKVGHATLIRGDDVRTGVTAVLPHDRNLFREKVPAAIFVGNGFGKLMGSTQVRELGEIETPILLTNTLNVPRVADALIDWMLALPGNEEVRSINPVVAETNDGWLNDIRGRHVGRGEVFASLKNARGGPVEEGSIGAGTGTVAFGFKGGIGTASRVVPRAAGGYTVGVLVQTNFGGVLTMNGAPVGRALGRYYLKDHLDGAGHPANTGDKADGSIIIVIATDAPLSSRNLERLAARGMLGLARTGSPATNGSGDYVIAFSTANRDASRLENDRMSPLFLAAVEATEEAIYNSLLRATTMRGRDGHKVDALPVDRTVEILEAHGALERR